jgi:hypothetical protein
LRQQFGAGEGQLFAMGGERRARALQLCVVRKCFVVKLGEADGVRRER